MFVDRGEKSVILGWGREPMSESVEPIHEQRMKLRNIPLRVQPRERSQADELVAVEIIVLAAFLGKLFVFNVSLGNVEPGIDIEVKKIGGNVAKHRKEGVGVEDFAIRRVFGGNRVGNWKKTMK
jgi:hypothetical protein